MVKLRGGKYITVKAQCLENNEYTLPDIYFLSGIFTAISFTYAMLP